MSLQVNDPEPCACTLTFLGIDNEADDGYSLLCLNGEDTVNITASCEVINSMFPECLTNSSLLDAFDIAGNVHVLLKGKLLFTVPTSSVVFKPSTAMNCLLCFLHMLFTGASQVFTLLS